jgi:hypothetical protein
MSKIKTTNKYIKAVWGKVFRAGYCDLQYIMKYEDPVYYNCGVYGWNYDAYCDYKKNIVITTGYRNMTGQRIPDKLIEKYTEIAKEILKDTWSKPYDELKEALDQNRRNFFDELDNI